MENKEAIGYYGVSNCITLIITDIIYDINDYIEYYMSLEGERKGRYHKVRIYYTATGEPYFIRNNKRIHLNECLRVGG